jgi:hypothetical protein
MYGFGREMLQAWGIMAANSLYTHPFEDMPDQVARTAPTVRIFSRAKIVICANFARVKGQNLVGKRWEIQPCHFLRWGQSFLEAQKRLWLLADKEGYWQQL